MLLFNLKLVFKIIEEETGRFIEEIFSEIFEEFIVVVLIG